MRHPAFALGMTAAERPDARRLGPALERLGYDELWSNDNRRGDGLAALAASAADAPELRLGVGVIALSDHPAATVAERLAASGLDPDRLTLGVGSGASASLALVRDGVAALRRRLPGQPLGVAAVGPRMSRLAGEIGDAVIANWALPDRLRFVRDHVLEGAASSERPTPRLVAYVRTAVGPGAEERLRAEMDRYARAGRHYARAFAAQPDVPIGVAVPSADPAAVAAALEPYRAIADTVVVRGLPSDDGVDAWLEVAAAAAPR